VLGLGGGAVQLVSEIWWGQAKCLPRAERRGLATSSLFRSENAWQIIRRLPIGRKHRADFVRILGMLLFNGCCWINRAVGCLGSCHHARNLIDLPGLG
jgi:hypothetical protein